MANEQSLITEEELAECDEDARRRQRKETLMARGDLTDAQATWESMMSSDDECNDDMSVVIPDEGSDHKAMALKYRMERDELEFPDEVDVPVDDEARGRFERYRGLADFATTPWDVMESLPLEYAHIFRFQNYPAARKRVLAASRACDGVSSGRYCTARLTPVPNDMVTDMLHRRNLIASALHQYERQVLKENLRF